MILVLSTFGSCLWPTTWEQAQDKSGVMYSDTWWNGEASELEGRETTYNFISDALCKR